MKDMEWGTSFVYGKYRWSTVRRVRDRNPSYLYWTAVYTKTTFHKEVTDWMLANLDNLQLNVKEELRRSFSKRYLPGPW